MNTDEILHILKHRSISRALFYGVLASDKHLVVAAERAACTAPRNACLQESTLH